jgi:structural toxin protein (hemagglutinin/hemolysin) RtxA
MKLYQLYFYVPKTHLGKVKDAIFKAGAGRIGNYVECAWETKGRGQFCPLPQSNPFLGKTNILEKVIEYKVEVVCEKNFLKKVITALRAAHPYETPAFGIIKLENFD